MTLKRSIQTGRKLALVVSCALALILAAGCGGKKKMAAKQSQYPILPPKQVPPFLHDTIFERADLIDTEPLHISSYGVVARLANTADNTLIPTPVRSFIFKEMVKRGMGSQLQPGFENLTPEQMLKSASVAVVRVDGYLKPGTREGDRFDVQVSALEGSNTTSLAHGILYRTDLKLNGANPIAPGIEVDVPAFCQGPVFVNPAYALSGVDSQSAQTKASLRYGVVLSGAQATQYRPLMLKLRAPQRSLSRSIEFLIEQRFASLKLYQEEKLAAAKDEALILVQVPARFHGDWEHYAGVMTHLYLDTSPQFAAMKAGQLADEAVKPDAPLADISYCWEGLGTAALEKIGPLLTHKDPAVAFAAARAAAYIGDPGAQIALSNIANTPGHSFQINAVQILGDLPSSPSINTMLRKLLDANDALARIEAYKVLAQNRDSSIYSQAIAGKFVLDIVPSSGPPLIYASRQGEPRIAVFGNKPSLNLPTVFTAMDDQFSISSNPNGKTVSIYYRGPELRKPLKVNSNPDVAELIARLGGEGPIGEASLSFSYADVAAVVSALADSKQLGAWTTDGKRLPASFVLQDIGGAGKSIYDAPVIGEPSRPQAEEKSAPIGAAETGSGMNPTAATIRPN